MSRPLTWPHIYARRNAGGSTTYVVDGGLVVLADGGRKRERFYCKTRKAANERAVEMRTNREQRGAIAARQHAKAASHLTECLAVMTASGFDSLKEAVELAASAKAGLVPTGTSPTATTTPGSVGTHAPVSLPPPAASKPTREVIDEMIDARIEAKKGQAESGHETIMRLVLKKALRKHLEAPIHTIDVAAVEKALAEGTKKISTRGRWLSAMNHLFRFASHTARGYMACNPAGAVVRPVSYEPTGVEVTNDKGPVHILTATEFTRLLRLAEGDERYHCMIMPLAVQGFLCLRRGETRRFASFQLNSNLREYDVVAKRTRSRQNRDVQTNPTFEAWRRRYWTSDSKLYPDNYTELLRQMVTRLGLKWTRNTIRHTAASNYLLMYGEEATVKQLGHRDSDMLYRHYRRKVSSYEAERYRAIVPIAEPKETLLLADVLVDQDSEPNGSRAARKRRS